MLSEICVKNQFQDSDGAEWKSHIVPFESGFSDLAFHHLPPHNAWLTAAQHESNVASCWGDASIFIMSF